MSNCCDRPIADFWKMRDFLFAVLFWNVAIFYPNPLRPLVFSKMVPKRREGEYSDLCQDSFECCDRPHVTIDQWLGHLSIILTCGLIFVHSVSKCNARRTLFWTSIIALAVQSVLFEENPAVDIMRIYVQVAFARVWSMLAHVNVAIGIANKRLRIHRLTIILFGL